MNIFGKIVDMLSGGLGGKIVDAVSRVLPAAMSEQDRAKIRLKIMEATQTQELALLQVANQADHEFNQRIKDMEGTARDLLAVPVLGVVMVFLRGSLRPLFCFFTLIMDWMVYSGAWALADGTTQERAFLAINILVLGFLFGERAVKNLLPLFDRYFGNKSAG